MDILVRNENVIDKAKELLLNYNLIVDGEEFEITSVSLHHGNRTDGSFDPYVQSDNNRSQDKWFPYQEKLKGFNKYLDYDLSNDIEVNGIRINSIKSIRNPKLYPKSCGDVFDTINNVLVGEVINDQFGKDVYSNEKLFLKGKPNKVKKEIIYLPRYGDFTKKSKKLSRNLRHLFCTQLLTTELDIFSDLKNPYEQIKVIAAYLFILGYEEEAEKICPTDKKVLLNYIRNMLKSSGYTPEALYNSCENKEYLNIETVFKIFGYYCIKHHEFK